MRPAGSGPPQCGSWPLRHERGSNSRITREVSASCARHVSVADTTSQRGGSPFPSTNAKRVFPRNCAHKNCFGPSIEDREALLRVAPYSAGAPVAKPRLHYDAVRPGVDRRAARGLLARPSGTPAAPVGIVAGDVSGGSRGVRAVRRRGRHRQARHQTGGPGTHPVAYRAAQGPRTDQPTYGQVASLFEGLSAGAGSRTRTGVSPADFKSAVSSQFHHPGTSSPHPRVTRAQAPSDRAPSTTPGPSSREGPGVWSRAQRRG